jgi:hypothetical protein
MASLIMPNNQHSESPLPFSNLLVSPPQEIWVELDGENVAVRDQDLVEQIVSAPASILSRVKRRVAKVQVERDQAEQNQALMKPIAKRRQMIRHELSQTALESSDIHCIHSVLGLCGLPYKRLQDNQQSYLREYGKMSVVVQAGYLKDPNTGKMILQGVPYGPKARLLLLHICTRALRQRNPEVELESNLSAFIKSMGFDVTGGKKGTLNLFKEQISRLAACRLQIGLWNGIESSTLNTQPISRFDVWLPPSYDSDQRMLWSSKVTLSQEFYNSLESHALPVDIRSLAALSHSARQMDLLLWLSYRLREVHKPYLITWNLLKEQFCQSENRRLILFQNQLKEDLHEIMEVFEQKLPISLNEKGLMLFPCDPDKLFVPSKGSIKKAF